MRSRENADQGEMKENVFSQGAAVARPTGVAVACAAAATVATVVSTAELNRKTTSERDKRLRGVAILSLFLTHPPKDKKRNQNKKEYLRLYGLFAN